MHGKEEEEKTKSYNEQANFLHTIVPFTKFSAASECLQINWTNLEHDAIFNWNLNAAQTHSYTHFGYSITAENWRGVSLWNEIIYEKKK